MKRPPVLSTLRKRLRQFKEYGYDLPVSRRFILKVSGIRRGRVLEIGAGKGHLTALLAQKGCRPVAIDLDGEVLKTARAHLQARDLGGRASFRKMNAEELAFSARSFDRVISVDFFHHARDPLRCLKEMMRVTRQTLTIADLNPKGMRIMDRIHKEEGKRHETPRVPFRKLGSFLRKNGFIVKSYRHPRHEIFVAQRRKS